MCPQAVLRGSLLAVSVETGESFGGTELCSALTQFPPMPPTAHHSLAHPSLTHRSLGCCVPVPPHGLPPASGPLRGTASCLKMHPQQDSKPSQPHSGQRRAALGLSICLCVSPGCPLSCNVHKAGPAMGVQLHGQEQRLKGQPLLWHHQGPPGLRDLPAAGPGCQTSTSQTLQVRTRSGSSFQFIRD